MTDFVVCDYSPPGNIGQQPPFKPTPPTTAQVKPSPTSTPTTGDVYLTGNPQITNFPVVPRVTPTPNTGGDCDVCKSVQQLTAQIEQIKKQLDGPNKEPVATGGTEFDLRGFSGGSFDARDSGVFYSQHVSCNPGLANGSSQNLSMDVNANHGCGFALRFREIGPSSWKSGAVGQPATRLMARFSNVQEDVQLWVSTGTIKGNLKPFRGETSERVAARATRTDDEGAGPFVAKQPNEGGLVQVPIYNGSGQMVWEVSGEDPSAIDAASFAVAYAYISNPSNNRPTPGITLKVNGGVAPVTVRLSGTSAGVPWFSDISTLLDGPTIKKESTITKESTALLFAFVSNQLGYDTSIAISNTTLVTGTGLGAVPMQGVCTLNYYCGQTGCTNPTAQTTNAPIPAGQQLTLTMSGGGNYGIAATPGFQGYIIAQCYFPFARGFAYISAQGALPTSNGASMGYIAEILEDRPGVQPRRLYQDLRP